MNKCKSKILKYFIVFIRNIYNSPGHNFLLHNAILGNVSSQYNLAKFYLTEKNDYVEAYAWAELASYRHHPNARIIKSDAEKNMNPEQIEKAWKRARNYKLSFNKNSDWFYPASSISDNFTDIEMSFTQKINNELLKNNSLRLVDIKINKECWFQCLNSYSVFYKTPLQILNNQFIIERMLPYDSCIIGVICGEMYDFYLKNKKYFHSLPQCNENNETDFKYKFLSVSRKGTVQYEDINSEVKTIENIIDLAKNENLIKCFSSADSFYIGFLAGIELFKIKNHKKAAPKNKPKLKLVYSRL